jgi:hypothetical protein
VSRFEIRRVAHRKLLRDAMTSPARPNQSRSLRLYARLLELYPPSFLERHRAEMLQNFADLENAAEPKAKLWLLIGKDLVISLISQSFRSRLFRYVISVVTVWMLLFIIGYFFYGPTRPSALACFRRLSARDAGHVHRDTFLRNAAKQHFALFQVAV